jgi:hypothetical protein
MNSEATKSLTDLTQESVHTSDDKDIGDIEATNKEVIVVKRGVSNIHYYYIPIDRVEGWDEHVVRLNITEQEVKDKYEKNLEPDPSKYYTKNQGYGNLDFQDSRGEIPKIAVIAKKGK